MKGSSASHSRPEKENMDNVSAAPPRRRSSADDDADAVDTPRQSLRALWTEAGGSSELPAVASHEADRLHHRRTNGRGRGHSKDGPGGRRESPSRRHRGRNRRRGRTERVAKQVWLAAFAALGTAFVISVHVILYRALFASGGDSGGEDGIDPGQRPGKPRQAAKRKQRTLAPEDEEARMTLDEARRHRLASLDDRAVDRDQYTVRINTWRRDEQLLLSLNHHASCDGVKEVQVVWCDSENDPPESVTRHSSGKVRVERHEVNSLNERFKVLVDPPTLGILSLDDDVLRPCAALDAAFLRWTRHPDRMVGFDARTVVAVGVGGDERTFDGTTPSSTWKYGYMSTTEKSNGYAMTLPRAAFLHRDYLDLYTMALPREMYRFVAENLECEDVAMSFFVSSLTGGKVPLLADYWAVKSMVKLYSDAKISGGKNHKAIRDGCVDRFAGLLGLKEDGPRPLHPGRLLHAGDAFFQYGAQPEPWETIEEAEVDSPRMRERLRAMQEVRGLSQEERILWLTAQKYMAMMEAKKAGMIEKTAEWKKRWQNE